MATVHSYTFTHVRGSQDSRHVIIYMIIQVLHIRIHTYTCTHVYSPMCWFSSPSLYYYFESIIPLSDNTFNIHSLVLLLISRYAMDKQLQAVHDCIVIITGVETAREKWRGKKW